MSRIHLDIEVGRPPGASIEECREVAQIILDGSGSVLRYDTPIVTIPSVSKRPGAKPLNFPTTVRPDLRNMRGLGARIAESVRWSA